MDETLLKLLVLRELMSDSSSEETVKSVLLEVGLRVVRGPDWKWDNQDDGEGHVGTVVEIGSSDSSLNKTVVVQWDCGTRKNYRIGFNGGYDIRTLDNAPLGVKHPTVTCNSCRKKGILGMRWKCKLCNDYDLCNQCYMSDKHDITHPFVRHQTVETAGVEVPKRQGSTKLPLRGIFASAKVVRGPDWKWENQDGGAGKTGLVTDVCGWGDNSDRNAVHVTWAATDSTNLYRLGSDGKVDLKYVEHAVDGHYYRNHLPILGDELRPVREEVCASAAAKEFENKNGNRLSTKESEDKTKIQWTGSNKGLNLLSQSLMDLFSSDQFCDLTLKVKDRRFQIHKAILSARSSVFSTMLQHSSKSVSVFEVPNYDPDIFEDFLYYLYTGKMKDFSLEKVNVLYELALEYNVESLKDECVRFKKEGISLDYICDSIAAA